MTDNLLVSLVLNVGLLILAATILSEFGPTRKLLQLRKKSLPLQIPVALLFGGLGICSTFFGIELQGAIANTRVVSIVAAGLIGGPAAGIGAGLIAGVHRYFYRPGYTALACGIGTVVFGIIGGLLYKRLPPHAERRNRFLVGVTVLSELLQAAILFAVARPFADVLALEKTILLPKIVINSFGMVLFFETFFQLTQNKQFEETQQQSTALFVANKCLPYLRNGLSDVKSIRTAAQLICQYTSYTQVVITDESHVIAAAGLPLSDELPPTAVKCIEQKRTVALPLPDASGQPCGRIAIASPFLVGDLAIGAVTLFEEQNRAALAEADMQFLESLTGLFSTMLSVSELNRQIELRRMAEIRALQSQINPHFLYNALNTISSLCRTNPDHARELILVLAKYFRQTLSLNEAFVPLSHELSNVENYLVLVRARFEDAITVETVLPEDPADAENCMLPPLLLQPLVENAVRHGRTEKPERYVRLAIARRGDRMLYSVTDKGRGFPPDILDALNHHPEKRYSGLFNVQRRLVSIYGPESGLRVKSSPQGSTVSFVIPAIPPQSAEKEERFQ